MRLNTDFLACKKPRGWARNGRVSRSLMLPSMRDAPASRIVKPLMAVRKLSKMILLTSASDRFLSTTGLSRSTGWSNRWSRMKTLTLGYSSS